MKMEKWKECKLGDILADKGYIRGPFGSALKRGDMKSEGIPVYEQQHAIYQMRDFRFFIDEKKFQEMKRFQVQENDLVISCSGTVGKVTIISKDDPKGIISQALLILRVNPNIILPKYLQYFFISSKGYNSIISRSSGSVQVNIAKRDVIESIPLSLPPLPTQQKIAAILSSLDDKIELNNKINTNLEHQAQALFKNWFVDFAPFGGKMPEGWKEKTLDSFCSIFTGRKNANASVENGKYKFFTCSPNVLPIDSFIFDGDAIIISGNGAYTGRTRFYSGKFDLYQRTYACTMKKDQNQDYIFILYWIIKFVLSKKIMGGTHGSAIPYIVMDDIAKFVINYDKKLFDDLSKIMKSYVLQIQENENQNEKLAELRDSLLPKLMNGEIEV